MKKFFGRFNNIFLRVYGSFAILIMCFALLLGLIFIRLYSRSNTNYSMEQNTRVAENLAERFRNYIMDEEYLECLSYLGVFNELDGSEVWTMANPDADEPMNEMLVSIDLSGFDLQEEFEEIMRAAFAGESRTDTFFSDVHGCTVLAIGEPVEDGSKQICGALILVTPMGQIDETIRSSESMIALSAVVALLLSAVVAFLLAKMITNPVRQMQKMAQEMTEGNYKVKTGINRTDEIGDMARSIDILADKLGENEIERQNMEQMRLDFFANVSHELRTPIAVVRAYTESLVDGVVRDEDKVHQTYERILGECKSMQRLVADLLTLSKMQNPNFKVEKEPVNLVQVMDDVVKGESAISQEKNIAIDFAHEQDVYIMMADYDRLRQMFIVIFDNALKFSPEGSTIHVAVESGERLSCSIRDEGIGISEAELPSIFDKFYKSKLRQNAKGTGLGLAIAKYICIKHDGEISVESEVGKGTCFTFKFHEATAAELEAYENSL